MPPEKCPACGVAIGHRHAAWCELVTTCMRFMKEAREEIDRLKVEVAELKARPFEIDTPALAAELVRLDDQAKRHPAAQARAFSQAHRPTKQL